MTAAKSMYGYGTTRAGARWHLVTADDIYTGFCGARIATYRSAEPTGYLSCSRCINIHIAAEEARSASAPKPHEDEAPQAANRPAPTATPLESRAITLHRDKSTASHYQTGDGRYDIAPRYGRRIRGNSPSKPAFWTITDRKTGTEQPGIYNRLADVRKALADLKESEEHAMDHNAEPDLTVCINCSQTVPSEDGQFHSAPCAQCGSENHSACQHR